MGLGRDLGRVPARGPQVRGDLVEPLRVDLEIEEADAARRADAQLVGLRVGEGELEVVDGPKPLFSVEYDETNGLVATLQRKMLDLLNRKSGGEVDKNAKKAPKEKLSRADKKAKKQAYGR